MIYNYGSINIDNVYRVPHLVRPGETLASTGYDRVLGGKGSNQSLAIARAGQHITHLGALGHEDQWVVDYLKESRVITNHIAMLDNTPSGHTFIQVDDAAENAIVLFPGANHAIPQDDIKTVLKSATVQDWLLAQNECSHLDDIIHHALAQGLKIALNPAPMDSRIAQLPLNRLTLLFLNEGEAWQLLDAVQDPLTRSKEFKDTTAEALAERLTHHFPLPEIILTLGSTGVLYAHGEKRVQQAAFKVNAKDTTGAGDTFVGYFLAARDSGETVEDALTLARAASALCVQKEGAAPSIPEKSAVDEFLNTQS
ncbi:Ribokinase [Halomonadaceae bacterium LMG 33818]|uniref:ribokinase n=1 Tax=Cernens ardua TaxID=3402176 RepID=UPI003EDC1CC3